MWYAPSNQVATTTRITTSATGTSSWARVGLVPAVRSSIAAIAVIGVALPTYALAQDAQVEPHASSPAGAVYEIPLETARRDAAPKSGKNSGATVAAPNDPGGGGAGGGGVLPEGSAV